MRTEEIRTRARHNHEGSLEGSLLVFCALLAARGLVADMRPPPRSVLPRTRNSVAER
jgi:hypothetical protein